MRQSREHLVGVTDLSVISPDAVEEVDGEVVEANGAVGASKG